CLQTRDFPYSF
nr:immunoglobulin light chain junction region [Macaca mulatta]